MRCYIAINNAQQLEVGEEDVTIGSEGVGCSGEYVKAKKWER